MARQRTMQIIQERFRVLKGLFNLSHFNQDFDVLNFQHIRVAMVFHPVIQEGKRIAGLAEIFQEPDL